MKGYIEVKEDSYEDTIEHLHRIKLLACKLIKMLQQHSEVYNEDEYHDMDDEYKPRYKKTGYSRYEY